MLFISSLFFFPFLGNIHLFDWDEINFAESAREMLLTGDFFKVQINFSPFWEKPPLFIWLQACSMNLIGVTEFAARLPNAICGLITLPVLFLMGKKLLSNRMGYLWAMLYFGSLLPHFYFKSGIIDPFFNLFIFCSIYFLFDLETGKSKSHIVAAVFLGLAILTKGPVALLLVLLCISAKIVIDRKWKYTLKQSIVFAIIVTVISFLWFGIETIKNGPWFLMEFISYQIRLFSTQDAGHGGPFYYHFVVLLIGCFPASIFCLFGFKKHKGFSAPLNLFHIYMVILLLVVLILFSIVKTKIIHYSSLAYFPITFIGAYYLEKIFSHKSKVSSLLLVLLSVIGIFLTVVFTALPLLANNPEWIIPILKDPFAVACLKYDGGWEGNEYMMGIVAFIFFIVFLYFFRKSEFRKAFNILVFIFPLCLLFYQFKVMPKLESQIQGSAISFFKELDGKDCYVDVFGYKSYAHLFYTKKNIPTNKQALSKEWLFHGPIDKDLYVVTKITKIEEMLQQYPFEEISRRGGFALFVRRAP